MRLSLFIDTSLWGASVGFLQEQEASVKAWTGFHQERGDADSAIGTLVQSGLSSLSERLESVDRIYVSHGPGSFTGIKVGLAWAFGFQAAVSKPLLIGMSSLHAGLQEWQRSTEQKLSILLPISRREAFLCWESSEAEAQYSSLLLHSEEGDALLCKLHKEGYKLCPLSPASQTQEWLETLGIESSAPVDVTVFAKQALDGMMALAQKREFIPQSSLKAFYMKKTSVEEKFDNKGKHDGT